MAKTGLLNSLQVQRAAEQSLLHDGSGLYLKVQPIGPGLDDMVHRTPSPLSR